ncbi:MAG: nucleotidyltransferase domain-containing protein [Acidobacteriota bacterium]
MTQPRSSSSVEIKSIDRRRVEAAVAEYVADLREDHPEVERVIWFGSWVGGLPSVGSDVDLCVVVSASPERPRDRIPHFLPDRFPTGLDLLVFTAEEFRLLPERSLSLFEAISLGKEVA